jgi:hypothetical protein
MKKMNLLRETTTCRPVAKWAAAFALLLALVSCKEKPKANYEIWGPDIRGCYPRTAIASNCECCSGFNPCPHPETESRPWCIDKSDGGTR